MQSVKGCRTSFGFLIVTQVHCAVCSMSFRRSSDCSLITKKLRHAWPSLTQGHSRTISRPTRRGILSVDAFSIVIIDNLVFLSLSALNPSLACRNDTIRLKKLQSIFSNHAVVSTLTGKKCCISERLDLRRSGHEDQRGIPQSAGYPVGYSNQLEFRR
jgi:hypothetical protein